MRPELVYISALRLNDMTKELTVKRIRGLKNDYKNMSSANHSRLYISLQSVCSVCVIDINFELILI